MRLLPLTILPAGALALGPIAMLYDGADPAAAAEQVVTAEAQRQQPATPKKPKKSTGKLVVTRADGSEFTIRARALKVSCGPLETEPPVRGILLTNLRPSDDGSHLERPIVFAEAVLADVRKGVRVTFPTEGNIGDPAKATLFIADPDGIEREDLGPNELSSAEEDASGAMFVRGKCGQHPRLKIQVNNATLDSEFHDSPSVRVRGTIIGRG